MIFAIFHICGACILCEDGFHSDQGIVAAVSKDGCIFHWEIDWDKDREVYCRHHFGNLCHSGLGHCWHYWHCLAFLGEGNAVPHPDYIMCPYCSLCCSICSRNTYSSTERGEQVRREEISLNLLKLMSFHRLWSHYRGYSVLPVPLCLSCIYSIGGRGCTQRLSWESDILSVKFNFAYNVIPWLVFGTAFLITYQPDLVTWVDFHPWRKPGAGVWGGW